MKTALLAILLSVATANPPQREPRYTLITKERRPNGAIVAEPIYPTLLVLEPLNAVAKGTVVGEALRCTTSVEGDHVYLDCDGSRFVMRQFSLQE